jgi:hypothetical protein
MGVSFPDIEGLSAKVRRLRATWSGGARRRARPDARRPNPERRDRGQLSKPNAKVLGRKLAPAVG